MMDDPFMIRSPKVIQKFSSFSMFHRRKPQSTAYSETVVDACTKSMFRTLHHCCIGQSVSSLTRSVSTVKTPVRLRKGDIAVEKPRVCMEAAMCVC